MIEQDGFDRQEETVMPDSRARVGLHQRRRERFWAKLTVGLTLRF